MKTFAPGEFLEARGRRWLIDTVTEGAPRRHRLVCVDDDAQGETIEACLAIEIDLQRPSEDAWSGLERTALADPRALGAHLRTTEWRTSSAADRRLFQAPFRAGIRLDAYQLLPLRKALDLPRANLLIADDVGLGKTVEAGLIVRELLLRRRIDFVLVAAPASMVLQWQDEMAQKFGLDFTIVDREHLLDTRRRRGFSANPWSLGSAFVLSHTVLANEDYVASLRHTLGAFRPRSLVILDEAHHAAPSSGQAYATESQMTRSVRDISSRFEHRLFLSATPHNGHSNAFATLLEMLDPQRFTRGIAVTRTDLDAVMVRRLKDDLRHLGEAFPERHVAPIVIDDLPRDAPELQLAEMLSDYAGGFGGGPRARFLLGNLQQRLFSSIAAFHRTLRTHRATLLRETIHESLLEDEEDEGLAEDTALITVATRDADAEARAPVEALAQVDAMLAITDRHRHAPDARIRAILDWMQAEMLGNGQWRDRRLILFTEWEDTRRWLVRSLEEGLAGIADDIDGRILVFTGSTSLDDRDAIKRAFNAPFHEAGVRVLVCTDAAREGINLQARCHDLFHVDLPWNPSRLEQRNGRIDRKLQPAPTVTCRYFSYAQRTEDRVLDALVAKTETVRRELGAAGQVIRDDLETRLRAGIGRGEAEGLAQDMETASSKKAALAARELGPGDEARIEALKREDERLQNARETARRRVGVDPADLQATVELALGRLKDAAALTGGGYSVPEAFGLDPQAPAFADDPSWQGLIDELRPGRPPGARELSAWRRDNPPRGLLFAPPRVPSGEAEPQDVVQLHLEHRLVKRLLSRFVAQSFRESLDRVAVITSPGAQARVVLIGRLALYGPQARRLHEEILTVTARWRDTRRDEAPLEPFGEAGAATTIEQLHVGLRSGVVPGEGVRDRIQPFVGRDIADLRPHLEALAAEAEATAETHLTENGAREAKALHDLLVRQVAHVEMAQASADPEQLTLALGDGSERRQREADRRSWEAKLAFLRDNLMTEPDRVSQSYRVVARRLEPIGLVYLWPGQ